MSATIDFLLRMSCATLGRNSGYDKKFKLFRLFLSQMKYIVRNRLSRPLIADYLNHVKVALKTTLFAIVD